MFAVSLKGQFTPNERILVVPLTCSLFTDLDCFGASGLGVGMISIKRHCYGVFPNGIVFKFI